MTVDCRDDEDIEKQFKRQNEVGNMLVRKFSFAPEIILFKWYCYPIYGCALWRHSYHYFIRKLTFSYSDTFKRFIDVPRFRWTQLAAHINVVFPKSDYSLMSRVTTSHNRIVTAIVNSDAYHHSPLMDNCITYIISIENVNVWWMTLRLVSIGSIIMTIVWL